MRLLLALKFALGCLFIATMSCSAQESHTQENNKLPASMAPARTPAEARKIQVPPLIERYIMDELKALRQELANTRVEMIREITDRELAVAQGVSNVANNTVTFFFYLFAAIGAAFAIWGWRSLQDLKSSVQEATEQEIVRLSREYEQRLTALEQELHSKGKVILDNQREIERTQSMHALWLQANQTPDPRLKIEIYDKILELSPGDQETMAYKADAALQLGDRDWALSLCNRILAENPESSAALYQRACAYAGLGQHDAAIVDLKLALEISPTLRERLPEEEEFAELAGASEFESLLGNTEQQDKLSVETKS